MRRYLVPGNLVLSVLTVLAAGIAILAFLKQYAPPPASTFATDPVPPGPSAPGPPRSVAFVADGYTSGAPDGGQGSTNYTALLADREDWRVTNAAVYGAGYVSGATLDSQLRQIADARPQAIVVSGGRADDGSDPTEVRGAADRLYEDLRSRYPGAGVVVIGPMWIEQDPPRRMIVVRDAIRDAAADAGLPFIDPIADRWFIDRDADGVAPNGVDLNDQGHRRLAELVDDAVRKSGVLSG